MLFSIVYELPPKQLIAKYPNAFVYVDDIAIIAKSQEELEHLLAYLSVWGSQIGIRFNPEKTEVFHFYRRNSPNSGVPKHVWWGNSCLPVRDPIFTYPGHSIAGTGYKGKARDALFASLQAQMAAYYEPPLTSFERARIVNSVLLLRWAYKGLFLWDVCWGNRVEAIFEDYVLAAPPSRKVPAPPPIHGHSASWADMCAFIQLVQRALRLPDHKMPTEAQEGHMPHMVEWYRNILLSFGMEMGRLPKARSSVPQMAPKRPRDDYDHLFDEKDSDDARDDSLGPHHYLHSLQLKADTSLLEANMFRDGQQWHQTRSPSDTT